MFPFSDFLKVSNYSFNRPFYESKGYTVVRENEGLLIVVNALGIKKDDIKIDVQNSGAINSSGYETQYIVVKGETNDEDLDYMFKIDTGFFVYKTIKEISWDATDGFLKIWVKFEEPVKPTVSIVRK